jgi:ABC-type transporter MlaC component
VKIAERAKKAAPKIAAAKKPEPPKVAAAVPPTVPSYTITTTRDNVTYQTTRIVPIPVTAAAVAVPAPLPAPAQAPAPTPVQEVVSVPTPVAQLASLPTPAPLAERKPAASFAALTSAAMTPPPKALSRDPAPPPQPRAAASATGFVSSFLARAFRVARDTSLNSLQRRAELADLFAASMDVSRIAGITTGDELTGETSDFQRRFRSILISYLVETYYPRIELAADPSVTVETTAATPLPDGTAVVWTTFNKSSWVTQSVKWHLVPAGDGYKIVDIYSAGASLVQMERDTFLSVMRDGGLPELMAKIDARTRALASAATE